jgi:hypothetical protein
MSQEDARRHARLMHAKAAELEQRFVNAEEGEEVDIAYLVADVALLASVLADLLDRETER